MRDRSGRKRRAIMACGLFWPTVMTLLCGGASPLVLCDAPGDHLALEWGFDGCALASGWGRSEGTGSAACCGWTGSGEAGAECRDLLLTICAVLQGRDGDAPSAAGIVPAVPLPVPTMQATAVSALETGVPGRFLPPRSPSLRI